MRSPEGGMTQDGVGAAGGSHAFSDGVWYAMGVEEFGSAPEYLDFREGSTVPVDDSSAEPFERFYRRELPRLAALAQALCGPGSADDVAQEAMLAAFRRWGEVSGYESPEAWVRRVCVNKAASILRRRGAEARAVLRLAARPEAHSSIPEHDVFWAEVRRLPRRQAQAAALRYVYDMSLQDIAGVLGCSTGAVKVHLSRARKVLGERLEVVEEEPS